MNIDVKNCHKRDVYEPNGHFC
uniref:Uncharacterized protein n=1 Tax=Lepeophtheirus salmonis TaxID=72036 RepID=A0A0K2VAZ0_LEPSM